ncbi:ParB-like nuclease domain [Serratia quinivorans]|uniref:ParB-like nuclease domain n=2 Tax=Serratia TaxID=613 RepID=A0A380D948_9GAMM|nr:ParB-like nuclease domain [Serratia quinivorans]SUJ86277.1 ParB-like nuclease domain [Serratia quinivorans]
MLLKRENLGVRFTMLNEIKCLIKKYIDSFCEVDNKINAINELKKIISQHSPFSDDPVDCVVWLKTETIKMNNYNPNLMATPEIKLLKHSIKTNGFTQPVVVSNNTGENIIIDGSHRFLISTSIDTDKSIWHGYLPVVEIKKNNIDEKGNIAATIRHNRARGKHQISAMSEIIRDLHRMGWKDEQIGRELGMENDEILRLKQITGLAELFEDEDFSQAWTTE